MPTAVQSNIPTNALTANLPFTVEQGDRISARVLSSGDGTANLKTTDGSIIRAKIEEGVNLVEGETISLIVSEKNGDRITLNLIRSNPQRGETASGVYTERNATFAQQLRDMGLPVNERTLANMESIVRMNPDMPLDKAAFLAANNIPKYPEIVQAALDVIGGEEKVGSALVQILTTLETIEPETAQAAVPMNTEELFFQQPGNEQVANGQGLTAQAEPGTITEWAVRLVSAESETAGATSQVLTESSVAELPIADITNTAFENSVLTGSVENATGTETPDTGDIRQFPAAIYNGENGAAENLNVNIAGSDDGTQAYVSNYLENILSGSSTEKEVQIGRAHV